MSAQGDRIIAALNERCAAAEARLTAANALLVDCARGNRAIWPHEARAHLAAQPATAPARDEAEQAVLDAVAAYVSHWKRTAGDDEIGVNLRCDVISAELARREAK